MKTRGTFDLLKELELHIGKTPLLQAKCLLPWHLEGHQSEVIRKVIRCRVQAPDGIK
jgi:hypothetical protein